MAEQLRDWRLRKPQSIRHDDTALRQRVEALEQRLAQVIAETKKQQHDQVTMHDMLLNHSHDAKGFDEVLRRLDALEAALSALSRRAA